MTREEFSDWLGMHRNRFPGVDKLIGGDETIAADFWAVLSRFTADELRAATRDIMAMDPQPFPGDHLGKIRALCRTVRFRKHEREPQPYRQEESYRCGRCRDRGSIHVFHPCAYRPIVDGTFDEKQHLREIVVACNCAAGQPLCNKDPENIKQKDSLPNMLIFNEQTMFPMIDSETRQENTALDLVQFVTERYQPRNYNPEFAAFE